MTFHDEVTRTENVVSTFNCEPGNRGTVSTLLQDSQRTQGSQAVYGGFLHLRRAEGRETADSTAATGDALELGLRPPGNLPEHLKDHGWDGSTDGAATRRESVTSLAAKGVLI